MITLRHIASLFLPLFLAGVMYWLWSDWNTIVRAEPLRPVRGILLEWRVLILAIAGFLAFSLAEWGMGKITSPASDEH